MAFLATHLVQNIYNELGEVPPIFGLFSATGGSATTFICDDFADYENPPETDAFKNSLLIVTRDAGGAGASPEGRWGIVSAYADGTQTGTMATVTDAIAAGDVVMLAKQDKFPLQQVLFSINRGLESLGDLPSNPDTSLTAETGTYEYSLPVAAKRGLRQVWVWDDPHWSRVYDYRVELTEGGTAGKLILKGYSGALKLIYDGAHPKISAYDDEINEYVHPNVATAACVLKLLEWYNRQDANQDAQSYHLWLENEYRNRYLPIALAGHPIQRPRRTPGYSIFTKGEE